MIFRSDTEVAGSIQSQVWLSAKLDMNPIHGCIGFMLAERDSSGILFIAAVLQKQPSTGGEALRDVIKRNKKIQADSPFFVLAQRQAQKSAHKNKNKKM